MAKRGRRPTGEVKTIWRKRDQQWRFALRIPWRGERVWVPLGLEADGWNEYRAKLELENVMREDLAASPMARDAALANAPLRDDPFLRVPTVLEEGR